jgi:hypothetical protein
VEYTIDFTENFDSGTITVFYTDIRSSESDEEKQKADFDELIQLYQEDNFLLDMVEEGVYVKERTLYEKNGMIMGGYSGIFQKVQIDNNVMDLRNDERFILLNISENEKIETNGKVYRSENNALLVWPKDQKNITIKKIVQNYNNTGFSIINYYNDWKK